MLAVQDSKTAHVTSASATATHATSVAELIRGSSIDLSFLHRLPSPSRRRQRHPYCYRRPTSTQPRPYSPYSTSSYPLMGQANSRSRPAPYPLPQQDPSPSNPLSQPVHRGRTDSGATTASASSKNSRSSSFRRSVRSLLPHSRPTQDHSAPRHSPSSIRKRWRSSRYSNSPATLQDLPESTNDDDPLPFPSSLSPDAHHLIPEEHLTSNPSSAELAHSPISPTPYPPIPIPSAGPSTTHHSLYPSELSLSDHPTHADLPDFLDPPRPPQVDQLSGHIGTEHADQIERDLDDFLSHTHDKPFVQGSSRDGQSPPPLLDPVMPAQSISEPSSSDSPPQLPRHFQPPGPLVVVQGVVNTSDNPAIPQSSSASRSTRTNSINPSTAPSISLPRSSSNPRSGSNSEERQSARSRLSAFIPRTSTMLNRRSPTPDPNSVPTSESGFTTDASSTLQDSLTYDVLSSDEDTPPTSDAEQRSSQDSDIRPRPLSPGSIDVLGTLLRYAHDSSSFNWHAYAYIVWQLQRLRHLSSLPVWDTKPMPTPMVCHRPEYPDRCRPPQRLAWVVAKVSEACLGSGSTPLPPNRPL